MTPDVRLPPVTLPRGTPEDTAYLLWCGHTLVCPECTAKTPCARAVALGRAWRKARR